MLGHGKPKFKILLIGLGLFLLPFLSHAQVSKIVFTTEPQTIGPSEISSIITTQTQDNLGNSFNIPNTMYVTVTSSSATGQFFSSTSRNVLTMPVTMSKGSANKNFYYEDSTLGTYILQANIYSEKGGPVIFSTQQQIIVAINSATTTPVVDQTPNNTEQTSSNNTTTQTGNTSVHYSSIPLSNVIPEIAYKVGAGRSRLGTVGTPIEFRGESNADFSGFTNYKWSFGDGAIGYGHIISHSYAYPGDYVVVLNATSPAGQAISRTDVKIIPADFVLSDISSERIEVTNNSNYEVNLFGRALQSEGKVFIFPEDTIIKVGQSISFGHSVTGLQPINIYDASLIVVGDTVNKTFIPPPSNLAVEKEKQVADLYIKAQALQEEIAALPPDQINQTENLASAIGSLESLPASVATSTLPTHRGWFQIIKEFFLGRK